MKTKEFINKIESLRYRVVEEETCFAIEDTDGSWLAIVGKNNILEVSTDSSAWRALGFEEKISLFVVIYEYASTPVDEREEPTKYYLQHKYYNYYYENYVNLVTTDVYTIIALSSKDEIKDGVTTYKSKFTNTEIDELVDRFGINLSELDKIEVEE